MNYLDFVVHIVDIAILLVLFTNLIICKLWRNKKFLLVSVLILGFFVLQNLVFRNPIVLYFSLRLSLFMLCAASFAFSEVKPDKKVLIYVLLAVGVTQALLANLQFLRGSSLGLHFLGESHILAGAADSSSVYLPGGLRLRGYGTFPHPNVLGGFLSLSFGIVLRQILEQKKHRFLFISALVIIFAGLIVTWSRSAWLLCLILSMFIVALKIWKNKKQFIIFWISSFLVLIGFFTWINLGKSQMAEVLKTRLIEQTSLEDVSITERKELNENAIKIIKDNPLFGIGVGNFIPAMYEYPVYTDSGLRLMQPVHNVFLLITAETGVLGILYLTTISAFIILKIKNLKVALFLVIVLLTVGMLDHYFWTLPQGLGLLLSFYTIKRPIIS